MADLKLVIVKTDTTTHTITIPDAKTGISRSQNLTPYYDTLNAAFSDFATIKIMKISTGERSAIKKML